MHDDVYIGLGSNLDQPLQQIRRALRELGKLPASRLLAQSPLYRSRPMGPAQQPDYINAVARIATGLTPLALLDALQALEQQHGRVRGPQRWGPRSLDLDVLLYGDAVISDVRLSVPHPGIGQRAFVLHPLRDVAPADLTIPGLGSLAELLTTVNADGLELLEHE